jgi:hypothetical protein
MATKRFGDLLRKVKLGARERSQENAPEAVAAVCRASRLACAMTVASRLLLAAAALLNLTIAAAAQEIFFGPREPRAPRTHLAADPDWSRFFEADAPWQRGASQVGNMELEEGYIDDASDSELRNAASGLARLGISIAVPLQSVAVERAEPCGKTEGYAEPERAVRVAEKLHRLGMIPKYIILDGPLDFGHYDNGPQACHFSIEETAQRTARTVRAFIDRFPDLLIGDIETSSLPLRPDWQGDYRAFKSALEAATGRRLESLTLDVKWRSPDWPQTAVAMAAMARSLGMRFGVIYNGDDRDESDSAWIAHAERNFTVLESERGIIPDIAFFSSWNKFPTHALPETSPQTMTWLIDRYRLPRTRFAAQREGSAWHVRLTDAAGHPLAGQRVAIERLGIDPSQPPPVRTASGTVPDNAAAAMIFLRVNAECFCAGANDLLLGDLAYRESGAGSAGQDLSVLDLVGKPRDDGVELSRAPMAGGGAVTRVKVGADRHLIYNSPRFAVTPGAHYEFRAPLGAVDSDGLFGFVRLLWRDRDDKPIGGPMVYDAGDRTAAGTAVTGHDGSFTVPASAQVRELSFSGTPTLRPALARLDPAK